jgi:hypothetical protein
VKQLHTELAGKFDSDWKLAHVLVATLLDPRFRDFSFPLRDVEMSDGDFDEYADLFASIKHRRIDNKSLDTRMFTAAVELYKEYFPKLWEADLATLAPTNRRLVLEENRVECAPLWQDLRTWVAARPQSLAFKGAPITSRTDPISFWKESMSNLTLLPLARLVLNVPASVLSVERIWKPTDKVFDKLRNRLEISTGGRQVFVQQVWRIARTMLENKDLSNEGRAFYTALLPFGKGK